MNEIRYWAAARRALNTMPKATAKRIESMIESYAMNPASQANNVKALSGQSGLRLRVGDWRVIMLDGDVLDIVKIGPRSSVYG